MSCVQEFSRGIVSEESIGFIQSLSRPLDIPLVEQHVLFAENISCKIYNADVMNELPGSFFVYDSQDEGPSHHLTKLAAEKVCISLSMFSYMNTMYFLNQ